MKVSDMINAIHEATSDYRINMVDQAGNGVIFIANDCDTSEVVILTSEDSEGIFAERALELLGALNPDATVVTSENVYINKVTYERVTRPTLVCSR